MPNLSYDIKKLHDDEIAGAVTTNRIIDYILGMRSQSEYLSINPNGRGSIYFDLDAGGLAQWILSLIKIDSIDFDFKISMGGNTMTVKGGRVAFPSNTVTVSGASINLDPSEDSGKMLYVRLTSRTAGSLVFSGAVSHTLQTGDDDFRVTLPLATLTHSNGWQVRYHHLGSFAFIDLPYFYVSGYSKSHNQALTHEAGENGTRWTTLSTCDESTAN